MKPETITVRHYELQTPSWTVASSERRNGTSGYLGAFHSEDDALLAARTHCRLHAGAPYNAQLDLTETQAARLVELTGAQNVRMDALLSKRGE